MSNDKAQMNDNDKVQSSDEQSLFDIWILEFKISCWHLDFDI